jgi:FkbM family methyltransferase
MAVIANALRRVGPTALGPPLARVTASLARRRVLSHDSACRVIEELVSQAPWPVVCSVDLVGHPCELELDLSINSCRSLYVQSPRDSFDWPSIRLFCALAREATAIVDVGANIGVYTYLSAAHAPRARILAYEPTPRLADLVERNLARNGWSARVDFRRAGVSASSGIMAFFVRENDHESTFEPTFVRGDVRDRIEVPVVALDDVMERDGIAGHGALMKIDVEGHETRLLDGLERTLRRSDGRPTLLIEFLGRAITDDRIIDRVLGFGLDVYAVGSRSLTRLGRTSDYGPVQEPGHYNFLVTERSPADVARLSAAP